MAGVWGGGCSGDVAFAVSRSVAGSSEDRREGVLTPSCDCTTLWPGALRQDESDPENIKAVAIVIVGSIRIRLPPMCCSIRQAEGHYNRFRYPPKRPPDRIGHADTIPHYSCNR